METTDHSGELIEERYRLLRKLAEGGMGAVYLGEHAVIRSLVAVKLLRSEFVGNERMVKRFYREAQAAAAIQHANIIRVFDVGVAPWGEPYFVMEYLEGESLGDMSRRVGAVTLAAACGIMEQLLLGLAAAHELGFVHRDLKPENIFLVHERGADPAVKIIDFGITKFLGDEETFKLTQTGSVLGTLEYMSPEQAAGKKNVDHRSDIYAAGIIFYLLTSGTVPYMGENYNEVLARILTEPPRPPSDAFSEFPAEAEPIIMRALRREPDERYQSALQMLAAIRQLSVFDEGREELDRVADGLSSPSMAIGDLGEMPEGRSSSVATAVLDEVKRERTPGEWAKSARTRPGGSRRGRGLPLVSLAGIALVAAAVVFFLLRPDEIMPAAPPPPPAKPAAVDASPPAEEPDEGVLIAVEGVPDGGQIYFDDLLVPVNPFRVERRATLAGLRVQAEGYEELRLAVVPDEDRVVRAELTPEKRAGPRRPAASRPKQQRSPAAAPVNSEQRLARTRQHLAITKRRHELRRCYNAALRSGDAPRDRDLVIHFRADVAAGGAVDSVKLSGSGATVAALNSCLERTILDWQFPPGEARPVEFSFAFAPPTPASDAPQQ